MEATISTTSPFETLNDLSKALVFELCCKLSRLGGGGWGHMSLFMLCWFNSADSEPAMVELRSGEGYGAQIST